jgi:hypothetical protein
MYRHFMNPNDPSNDIVVRITAARQLRWVVDELSFDADAFLPFTSDVLTQLMELIQSIDVDETKLAILETVRLLVTRMEGHVSQFGDFIMGALPAIWENSGSEEYMIKQAVIAIFSALAMSMGNDSQRYQHFMLPLLAEAARPGSDLHVHLVDESLELWNSLLMQSNPPLSPDLINLLELALPLLDYQSETASQSLSAVESYIIMAPNAVLDDRFRRPTLMALGGVLERKGRDRIRTATACIEYLIRSAAEMGGSTGVSVIMQDMLETGFMAKILEDLHEAWDAHQTTGPNRKISKLNTITEREYFTILARLALAEPNAFVNMLSSLGALDSVWKWLGEEWFSHMSSMDHIELQKLYLLGLTRLLEIPAPTQSLVLDKLQDYVTMWNNVLSDLQDGMAVATDCLIWTEAEPSEWSTPKSIREGELSLKDPIHSVVAFDFVKIRIQDVVQRIGEQKFQEEWAANVDKHVMDMFWTLIQSTSTPQQQPQ